MNDELNGFQEVNPLMFSYNPAKLIGKDWAIITAQDPQTSEVNALTVAWGGFGWMWEKPIAICMVRPERYSKKLLDAAECFSMSFVGNEFKDAKRYLGTVSGRDEDKIAGCGLELVAGPVPYFAESQIVMICRKLYVQPMESRFFIDKTVEEKRYTYGGYHDIYYCEIEQLLVKEGHTIG